MWRVVYVQSGYGILSIYLFFNSRLWPKAEHDSPFPSSLATAAILRTSKKLRDQLLNLGAGASAGASFHPRPKPTLMPRGDACPHRACFLRCDSRAVSFVEPHSHS
jgi:hypothetical protein